MNKPHFISIKEKEKPEKTRVYIEAFTNSTGIPRNHFGDSPRVSESTSTLAQTATNSRKVFHEGHVFGDAHGTITLHSTSAVIVSTLHPTRRSHRRLCLSLAEKNQDMLLPFMQGTQT